MNKPDIDEMNTRNQASVNTFDKYAGRYADKYRDHEPYLDSYQLLLQMLQPDDARILDIACGPGLICEFLLAHRPAARITGIDLSLQMVELARQRVPGATFLQRDCRRIGDLAGPFDALLCGFFIPYLAREELGPLLADAREIMRPGGLLYLSAILGDHAGSGYQSRGEDRIYTYYYGLDELESSLAGAGFSIEQHSRIAAPEQSGSSEEEVFIYCRAV